MAGTANRYATVVTWTSLLAILVAIVVLMRALPVDRVMSYLGYWLEELGVWAPIAFGVLYAVAVVCFFPGSPLTLAAGAVFGLGWGMVVVSLASTVGAALAFLIARYVARRKVAAAIEGHPRLAAIDRAIGASGWKIVALLRLTPAVPFSISNYVFGVTPIRFWPYVLASWVCMLPGTFMYVYFGYVGGAGLAAAADPDAAATTPAWVWVVRAVGLVATVVVTVYITRLAARAVKERTGLEARPAPAATDARWPWGATVTAVVAVLLLGAAGAALLNRDTIRGFFGPQQVVLAEAYSENVSGPSFDHSLLDGLLSKHVDADGWVDYEGVAKDAKQLDEYVASLASAPFDEMGRDERLALLINAYNAFTLRLILDYSPVESIRDIPGAKRWDDERWNVGGHVWSLNQIEHEQIRPRFREPRIHFALVCAAVGCPPLRTEAYTAERLEEQLEDQTRYVHRHDRWFRLPQPGGVVYLTQLYDWYGGDFKQTADSVLSYAARYSSDLKKALESGREPKIKWLEYDWSLNAKDQGPERSSGR